MAEEEWVGISPEQGESLWQIMEEKMESAKTQGASNNIVVMTRTRPFNQREKDLKTYNCIECKSDDPTNQQVWIRDPAKPDDAPSEFRYDFCFDVRIIYTYTHPLKAPLSLTTLASLTHQSFDPKSSAFVNQEIVFNSVGVDILAKAWSGYNACLFACKVTPAPPPRPPS